MPTQEPGTLTPVPLKSETYLKEMCPSDSRRRIIEFVHRTRLQAPSKEVYDWHLREGAFERLSPPWQQVELEDTGQGVSQGSIRVISTKVGPFRSRWAMRHNDICPNQQFVDVMERGPFETWRHEHRFVSSGDSASYLEDRLRIQLPFGKLGQMVAGHYLNRQLSRLFRYRHRITVEDLAAHTRAREVGALKILITGASGFLGTTLGPFLTTGGHAVVGLRRGDGSAKSFSWDPVSGAIDSTALAGADAVIHLAGENIGAGRWTASRKRLIRDSRIGPTRALCETLARIDNPPQSLLVASAIGYYGDRGGEFLDEMSPPGSSFLSGVVRDWEEATTPAKERGIRVVNLRFGVILSPKGGALERMLLPFKLCVGGVIGSGEQYWSWVGIDDVIGALYHALTRGDISGPVNVVSPNPVTNREFTKTLARVLGRPALLPLPAFAVRAVLGEMADELLLSSARVVPSRLQATSYQFRNPDLEETLRHMLGR